MLYQKVEIHSKQLKSIRFAGSYPKTKAKSNQNKPKKNIVLNWDEVCYFLLLSDTLINSANIWMSTSVTLGTADEKAHWSSFWAVSSPTGRK